MAGDKVEPYPRGGQATASDGQDRLSDRGLARLVGREIRRVREQRGWTRAQLVDRLPSRIGDRTLLSYEHGIRFVTVVRLIEICNALDIPASAILERAMRKAADLRNYSFTVNLRAIARDTREDFKPVQSWAATRLAETSNPELTLASATVREISALLGIAHDELAAYLIPFTRDAIPDTLPPPNPFDHVSDGQPDGQRSTGSRRRGRRPEPTTRLTNPPPPSAVQEDEPDLFVDPQTGSVLVDDLDEE